jgi:hypothetical protein
MGGDSKFKNSQLFEFGNVLALSINGLTGEIKRRNSLKVEELLAELPGIDVAHEAWSQEFKSTIESAYGRPKESK